MKKFELKTKVLESVCKAVNAISQDKTRYDLNHVRLFLSKPMKAQVEATDGHCLAQMNLDDAHNLDDSLSLYFTKDAIKIISKEIKSLGNFVDVEINPNGQVSLLLKSSQLYLKTNDDVNFPDTEPVIPKKMPEAFIFGINPTLLKRLADAISPKDGFVTLAIDDVHSPIRVFSANQEAIGVIMPARIERMAEIKETLGIAEQKEQKERVA